MPDETKQKCPKCKQCESLASACRDLAGQRMDDISKLNDAKRSIRELTTENARLTAAIVAVTAERDDARRQRDEAVAFLREIYKADDEMIQFLLMVCAKTWLVREGLAAKGGGE